MPDTRTMHKWLMNLEPLTFNDLWDDLRLSKAEKVELIIERSTPIDLALLEKEMNAECADDAPEHGSMRLCER